MKNIFDCFALEQTEATQKYVQRAWEMYAEYKDQIFSVKSLEIFQKISKKAFGNRAVIDVKNVPLTDGCNNTFKISARQHLTFEGAQVESLEHRDGFINYEIRPVSDKITLNFN